MLTALQKMVKERLDEVRAEADAELLAAYEDDGVTKKALRLGGVKVGDFVVVMNSGSWAVEDEEAFEDFALSYGFAEEERGVLPEWRARALEVLERELPEAISRTVKVSPKWQGLVRNVGGVPVYLDSGLEVPGLRFTGQTVKCTQARGCRPEDVAPIIRGMGGVDALLLGEPAEGAPALEGAAAEIEVEQLGEGSEL